MTKWSLPVLVLAGCVGDDAEEVDVDAGAPAVTFSQATCAWDPELRLESRAEVTLDVGQRVHVFVTTDDADLAVDPFVGCGSWTPVAFGCKRAEGQPARESIDAFARVFAQPHPVVVWLEASIDELASAQRTVSCAP